MSTHIPKPNNQSDNKHLWDYCWVRDLIFIIAVLSILWMAYSIRSVTSPILIGFSFAYVFNPFVTWCNRKIKWPRWLITLLIMLVAYVGLASVLIYVVPQAYQQSQQITQTIRNAIQKNSDQIDPFYRLVLQQFPSLGETLTGTPTTEIPDEIPLVTETKTDTPTTESELSKEDQSTIKHSLKDLNLNYPLLGKIVMNVFNVGVGAVGSAFNLASYLVLLLVIISFCFFFFSWKLGPLLEFFRPLIPMDIRERTLLILTEIDKSTNAFIRGRLIQSLVMSIILSLGWMFADVPSWLLLGIICGFLNLIPYAAVFGFLAALGLTVMSATGDGATFTWALLFWPNVVYIIAQLADGWIVEPIVQGKATNLDPLSVMLAVIIGGALLGLLGMLLAIPLASSIKIMAREWIVPELKAYAQSREPDQLAKKTDA